MEKLRDGINIHKILICSNDLKMIFCSRNQKLVLNAYSRPPDYNKKYLGKKIRKVNEKPAADKIKSVKDK